MVNINAITAIESCKATLVDVLKKYVNSFPDKEVKCCIYLPIYTDDTYNLDGYWTQNTITKLFIDKETGSLMAEYETYDEQFQDSIDECFNVGEIAHMIDSL